MGTLKKHLFKYTVLAVAVLVNLAVTGCGLDGYNKEKVPEMVSSGYSSNYSGSTPSAIYKENIADEVVDNGNAKDMDTSVSSGYYLALGVLTENVVFNGAERDEAEVAVAGKSILFPQGGIRSISIRSWSRKEKPYNPLKPGIIQYVDALESAEIVDDIPENVLENTVKIEMHIVYLNSNGEFRTICVTDFGNGYHEISVEKDDKKDFAKKVPIKQDTGKNLHQVFLHSMEAENIIKEWINWESVGKESFEIIQSASLSVEGNPDVTRLTEEQLKKLKTCLKAAKKTTGNPCGYENYFECIQNDGTSFHFSISADGESISTDQGVYILDSPDNLEIVELFKEIFKSA